jgi:excinuclease ABC subunit B
MKHQVLLDATGTGKTFTIASVIQELQMPAIVMAHNMWMTAKQGTAYDEKQHVIAAQAD